MTRTSLTLVEVMFGFKGRLAREAYWLGLLATAALAAVVAIPILRMSEPPLWAGIVFTAGWLAVNYVQMALLAKRCHDLGASGYFAVIALFPGIGEIVLLIAGLLKGQPHDNIFGVKPPG